MDAGHECPRNPETDTLIGEFLNLPYSQKCHFLDGVIAEQCPKFDASNGSLLMERARSMPAIDKSLSRGSSSGSRANMKSFASSLRSLLTRKSTNGINPGKVGDDDCDQVRLSGEVKELYVKLLCITKNLASKQESTMSYALAFFASRFPKIEGITKALQRLLKKSERLRDMAEYVEHNSALSGHATLKKATDFLGIANTVAEHIFILSVSYPTTLNFLDISATLCESLTKIVSKLGESTKSEAFGMLMSISELIKCNAENRDFILTVLPDLQSREVLLHQTLTKLIESLISMLREHEAAVAQLMAHEHEE